MKNNDNSIASFFSKQSVFVILVVCALFLRFKHEIAFPQLDSDYAVQIEAAKNYIEGKGFVNATATTDDLSIIHVKPLVKWPVGFPILLAGSFYIFHNWFNAGIFLQLLSVSLLLFSILKIFTLFGISRPVKALFVIFFGLSSSPFNYWATTDMMSVAVFLYITYLVLKQSYTNEYKLSTFLFISMLSAFNCTVRFAYIPYLFILPLFYLLLWFIRKNKALLIGAAVTASASVLLTFLFFSFFKIDPDRTNFLQSLLHQKLYWNHLKWFDSFPIKAFFYLSPLEYRLPVARPDIIRLVRILIHIASVALVCFFAWKLFIKDKIQTYLKSTQPGQRLMFDYTALSLIAAAAVIGIMMLESLATSPEGNSFGPAWMPKMWTFVYATRYFALQMMMLQILLFVLLFQSGNDRFSQFFIRGFLSVSICWAALFFAYSNYQLYAPHGNGGGEFWVNDKENIHIYKILHETNLARGDKHVVFSDAEWKGAPITEFSGPTPCPAYTDLINNRFKTSRPVILLLKMHAKDMQTPEEKEFIRLHQAQLLLSEKNSELYKVEI